MEFDTSILHVSVDAKETSDEEPRGYFVCCIGDFIKRDEDVYTTVQKVFSASKGSGGKADCRVDANPRRHRSCKKHLLSELLCRKTGQQSGKMAETVEHFGLSAQQRFSDQTIAQNSALMAVVGGGRR